MKEYIEAGKKFLDSCDKPIDLWSSCILHYELIASIDQEIEKAFKEAECQSE